MAFEELSSVKKMPVVIGERYDLQDEADTALKNFTDNLSVKKYVPAYLLMCSLTIADAVAKMIINLVRMSMVFLIELNIIRMSNIIISPAEMHALKISAMDVAFPV